MIDLRNPPRWPLQILKLICPAELIEEIEGDVVQKFWRDQALHGYHVARRKMIWNVVRFIRGGIILRNKFSLSSISTFMIPYYLRIAWRNIAGSKFYSSLNLLGLTLGLSVGLLILIWVNNEMSYDSFHAKADNIYILNTHLESNGEKFAVGVTQPSIGARAMKEVTGVKSVVRLMDHDRWSVFKYDKNPALRAKGEMYVDPSFFTTFDYQLVEGNRNNPFPAIHSIILTQSEATRFFGDEDPLGKTLIADNKISFVVSGVVKDFGGDSSIGTDMIFSTDLLNQMDQESGRGNLDEQWWNYGFRTFIELEAGASPVSIAEQLSKINQKNQPNLNPRDVGSYSLQPLTQMHLYGPDGKPTLIKTVRVFSLVAILILVIAAINYVNLTTARALVRSKEVSVRKVIGATRRQLLVQFIVHTCLFFFIAVILAFVVMGLSMPVYNNIAGKELEFNPLDPDIWKVIGITLFSVLIASSIYPALLLSSFNPVQTLKSRFSSGGGSVMFRKVLVVGQFAFSIGLIICTTIISQQLKFMLDSDLGLDKANVFSVQMDGMLSHYESAKAELEANPAVTSVSAGNGNIVGRYGATLDVDWEGKAPDLTFFIHDMIVDKDFIPLFKMEMAEGKNFSGTTADSSHFILNETAVSQMGLKDPVGKRFRWHSTEGTVIGVVKDFHFTPLQNTIQPFVFAYGPSAEILYVRADNKNMAEAVSAVNKTWSTYNPGAPFSFTFVDEAYSKHYASDQRTSNLFQLFTIVAIVISCLGLLGLITYTAQLKVKEIGIRKVLGASVSNIVVLLSKNFLLLIAISVSIAIPVSWYMMNNWLANFAYRTPVPWWVYAASCVATIVIAFVTIGFQSVRAAIENPVKSLRD